ncbi:MAG: hypothetical protein Q8922_00660 [Bacteroidota bacterium]|nr:hypothetical protein [Bacteroidota bacterium]MDP4232543.1 hypothetical protein [Bacteroidota bacterium]MDP4243002.1 hypothetical protein [Bacteroidota bacterium]MDP4286423.1 hypothetical protein [Bacteroidota bacterium]
MRLTTTIEEAASVEETPPSEQTPVPLMEDEAIQQIARDREASQVIAPAGDPHSTIKVGRMRRLLEAGKRRRTTQLLTQIWQSDYSLIAFIIVMAAFYLMKDTRSPVIGVLFFLFAMAEVDAILSIFVVRLSFHQNKHGFYRTEDFERDWLRYRMLLTMTKAALLFVVATSCGTATVIASYIMWFFTSTQRLRYVILRWSMDEHYPELQRWSIFALLREAGIEPKRRNFNLVALIGVILGFGIVLLF